MREYEKAYRERRGRKYRMALNDFARGIYLMELAWACKVARTT
jgi:hypothetical protein